MNSSTLAILLAGIGVVAKVLWTLYLSPLARQRIPGPKLAAVSDMWDYWMQFRGCRTFAVHDLFTVTNVPSFSLANFFGICQFGG